MGSRAATQLRMEGNFNHSYFEESREKIQIAARGHANSLLFFFFFFPINSNETQDYKNMSRHCRHTKHLRKHTLCIQNRGGRD